MLLPSQRRILINDFKDEYKELIGQLSIPLNTNMEFLYQALNKNISLKDNVFGELKEFTTSVDANGIPTSALGYQSSLGSQTLGMTVLRARHSTNTTTFVTSAPFVSFSQNGNTVTINNIKGLPANQSFVLTIMAYGS